MKCVLIALMLAVAIGAQEETTDTYAKDYPATPSPATTAAPQKSAYRDYNSEKPQPPMPYKFAWAVKDEPSKNDYSHQQESDGNVVTGSYRVALPDGRTQIVTYTADENGYRAEVKYEGVAQYPAYQRPSYSSALTQESYPTKYEGEAKYPAYQQAYPTTSTSESSSAATVPTPSTYSEAYPTTSEAPAQENKQKQY